MFSIFSNKKVTGGNRRPLVKQGECRKEYASVLEAMQRASWATRRVLNSHNVAKTIATLNVATLSGRSCELAAACRQIDLCALQETRCPVVNRGIDHGFELVYNGSRRTYSGVGIVVSQRFWNSIAKCSVSMTVSRRLSSLRKSMSSLLSIRTADRLLWSGRR